MAIITAAFDTRRRAGEAVRRLTGAGIPQDAISLVVGDPEGRLIPAQSEDDAETGAGIGAILGGASGLAAGLTSLAVPGIGPVVAAGWLVTTALGALTGAAVGGLAGGLVGALTEAGVPETEAHVHAESLRRGASLVTVRVDESDVETAAALLSGAGSIDVDERRGRYEAEGWSGFNPNLPPLAEDIANHPDRPVPYPLPPTVR